MEWCRAVVKPSIITRVPTVLAPNVYGCKAKKRKKKKGKEILKATAKLAVSGSVAKPLVKVASALRVRAKTEGAALMWRSEVEGSPIVKAAIKSAIKQWRLKNAAGKRKASSGVFRVPES